jgi:tetratricopeptide (TPR) repeat protein/tRNA A-37 threonylcarbamoyl transferase component Bud32
MPAQPDAIQRALDALTDDKWDWDAVEAGSATDAASETIRELRLVARIARTHQTMSGPGSPAQTGEPPFHWGPLEVAELVGRGTYGDVYRAYDPRLDRRVALKLLRYPERDRIRTESAAIEEGRLLARVRHPNVVTVHGAERVGDRVGIWMELVDGPTLEQELATRGPFSADELVAVGTALCGALHAAHRAGFLHRDLKAQNVMRDADGRVLLTDFGTGRELVDGASRHELVGTPLYLAPEVLGGGPTSVRSDIYSLGVLLHHLATGSFPVRASSTDALRDAHRRGLRTTVREARPDLPPPLASVIDRAASPDEGTRFESASAFEQALASVEPERRPARSRFRSWVAAAAVLVAVAAGFVWRFAATAGAPTAPRWVLVSPFENHSGDARLDHVLAVAFEQELAQSRALAVVPRERIADTLRLMQRRSEDFVDGALAREISLRDGEIPMFAVGRIDRVGRTYALNVTINDSRTGASIVRAGVDFANLDTVLDSVRTLAVKLRTAVGEDRRQVEADAQLERVTTSSLEALQAYTRGVALINEHRNSAAELPLRDAIRIDSGFASALIMLAHCVHNQRRPRDEYLPLAERALRVSEGLPLREKYFITGSYYDLSGELEKSIPAYEALVGEYPHDFWGVNNLVLAYRDTGRYREGVPFLTRLAALRPNDFTTTTEIATRLIIDAGDLASARRLVDRAANLEPPNDPLTPPRVAWLKVFPAFELWATGRPAEAADLLDNMPAEARRSPDMILAIGLMNLTLGRLGAAEEAFRSMSADSERQQLLAAAALARDDVQGARAALLADPHLVDPPRSYRTFSKWTFYLWTMIRAGLGTEAGAYAAHGQFDADPTGWIHGELAAARGEIDVAIPILERARQRLAPGNGQTLVAIETLGEALIQRGDLRAAEQLLLSLGDTRSTTYGATGSRGYLWIRMRARLLWLEGQLGNTARVHALEQELRQLLQVADRDFAPVRLLE